MRTVADCLADPTYAGSLDGASRVGRATHEGRVVEVGLWTEGRRVVRARYRASACASLIGYAEVACEALEACVPPERLGPGALRARLAGVHPVHLDRAELVAAAIRAAAHPQEEA
jgi:hypothetical protein